MANSNVIPITAYTNNFKIQIVPTHLPSSETLNFGAFLITFNDSYKTNFKNQQVYGRMDSIVNYQNTTRTLSISFGIPAASLQESIDNLQKVSNLIKFQYPVYSSVEVVSGISTPPICKMKFQNLINEYGDYLYGYFAGVDFTPTNEVGYFIDDKNNLYPKEIKISLNFTVLHTKAVGWSKNKWASGQKYPYGNSQQSAASTSTGINPENIASTDVNDQANGDEILT